MIDFEDYYEILGVSPEATPGEIKKTYREQCFVLHPDRLIGATDSVRKRAENELIRVNRAYDILKHPIKRPTYHSEWLRRKAKPKPIVNPPQIVFHDMEPGQVGKASFLIDNEGGHYTKIRISNPNFWLRIVDYHYATTSMGLPREIKIEAQAKEWGKSYSQSIRIKLDDEEAEVIVRLQTKPSLGLESKQQQKMKTPLRSQPRLQLKPPPEPHRVRIAPLITGFVMLAVLLIIGLNVLFKMQDKIVFESDYDGNPGIYIMNADGSNLRSLANSSESDCYPAWSPDGSKIAFQSDRDGNYEIYVINPDGSDLRRITAHIMSDQYPVWSPDSCRIAFQSDRDGDSEIYIRNLDDSNLGQLTDHPASDCYPVWSPDGRKIAFQSDRDSNPEIYVIDVDGSNLKRLTNHTASDCYPAWSPDGSKIFFQSDRNGSFEIYVMNTDGGNLKQLTYSAKFDQQKIRTSTATIVDHVQDDLAATYALSPNGNKIAFQSDRDGNAEIYVMNADGSNLLCLTDNPASDKYPRWSPDSGRIAFQSDRDGNPEIYIINADGNNLKRLIKSLKVNGCLMWLPKPFRLT